MPTIDETAYPRMGSRISNKALQTWYTPDSTEIDFANTCTRQPTAKIGLLVLLKCFQRLGRFVAIQTIPKNIVHHIANCLQYKTTPENIEDYSRSGSRVRHMNAIRQWLDVKPFNASAEQCMCDAAHAAAAIKILLPDIINAMIENLIKHRYELPAFKVLLRAARHARKKVNQSYYQAIYDALSDQAKGHLTDILTSSGAHQVSLWHQIKQEPKKPTVKKIHHFIKHLQWLETFTADLPTLSHILPGKLKSMMLQARALDRNEMMSLNVEKRFALATVLLKYMASQARDDLARMLSRTLARLHRKAQADLLIYQNQHAEKTDNLINLLLEVAQTFHREHDEPIEKRYHALAQLMSDYPDDVPQACQQHLAYKGKNHLPFLLKHYGGQNRKALFSCLDTLEFFTTNHDNRLIQALDFIKKRVHSKKE